MKMQIGCMAELAHVRLLKESKPRVKELILSCIWELFSSGMATSNGIDSFAIITYWRSTLMIEEPSRLP